MQQQSDHGKPNSLDRMPVVAPQLARPQQLRIRPKLLLVVTKGLTLRISGVGSGQVAR